MFYKKHLQKSGLVSTKKFQIILRYRHASYGGNILFKTAPLMVWAALMVVEPKH